MLEVIAYHVVKASEMLIPRRFPFIIPHMMFVQHLQTLVRDALRVQAGRLAEFLCVAEPSVPEL